MQTDMQDRYTDRRLYFNELAQTSREYLIGYIGRFRELANTGRVLEIGCGEGGNLLPFADMGIDVVGIDISKGKIDAAARCHRTYRIRVESRIYVKAGQSSETRWHHNGGIPGLGDAFRRTSTDMQEALMPYPVHTFAAFRHL